MSTSSQTGPSLATTWRPQLKHALKTGTAALLAVVCHRALPFMDNVHVSWAAVSAVIVMQSNLGGSWKASGSRLVGTVIGGTIGACVAWLGGTHLIWFWLAVCGTVLLCSSLRLHDALRLAGVTLALVMLSESTTNPWIIGWQRSFDVALGIVVALVVQLLLWPSRADTELRQELGRAIAGCGRLYEAAVNSCLEGKSEPLALDDLRTEVEQRIAKMRSLVEDWENEPLPIRNGDQVLMQLVNQVDEVQHHVLAVDYAATEMGHDSYFRQLESPLKDLADATIATFDWLALRLISTTEHGPPPDPGVPLSTARKGYEQLRKARVGSNFGDDEILRFCTFFFSMQAVSEGLRAMIAVVASSPQR